MLIAHNSASTLCNTHYALPGISGLPGAKGEPGTEGLPGFEGESEKI